MGFHETWFPSQDSYDFGIALTLYLAPPPGLNFDLSNILAYYYRPAKVKTFPLALAVLCVYHLSCLSSGKHENVNVVIMIMSSC